MAKLRMQHSMTSNPTGNGRYLIHEIKPARRESVAKQDPSHTEPDFPSDLAKATKRVTKP